MISSIGNGSVINDDRVDEVDEFLDLVGREEYSRELCSDLSAAWLGRLEENPVTEVGVPIVLSRDSRPCSKLCKSMVLLAVESGFVCGCFGGFDVGPRWEKVFNRVETLVRSEEYKSLEMWGT